MMRPDDITQAVTMLRLAGRQVTERGRDCWTVGLAPIIGRRALFAAAERARAEMAVKMMGVEHNGMPRR